MLTTDCSQSLKLLFAGLKIFWIAKFAPGGFYKLLSRRKADFVEVDFFNVETLQYDV